VATWDERKKTMETDFLKQGEQNLNGYDRQWFSLWDPADRAAVRSATGYKGPLPVNYLLFAEAILGSSCESGSCESAAFSTDGINYSDTTATFDMASEGTVVIDERTGTVLQAASLESQSDIGIARFTRDPKRPRDPALRKVTTQRIAMLPCDTNNTCEGGEPDGRMRSRALFPAIALDRDRNAYVVWPTRSDAAVCSTLDGERTCNRDAWQIWYSYASASSGWTDWSEPLKVSRPPAKTNVMPWAVAGADGRLAVVWYGTDDETHHPSTEDAHQPWDVYLSMITGADTAKPSIRQVKVTPHPMHYGTVCLEGLGCIAVQGNRNLADFFEVNVDPRDGALVIAYNDTSNELVQQIPATGEQIPPPIDGTVDHRGAAVVMLARQNGGVGLFGTPVRGSPRFGSALGDSPGDALFDPVYGDRNVRELDLRGVSVRRAGSTLTFRIPVTSLDDAGNALAATGAGAADYVVRWTGGPVQSPTGIRSPIYYAAVEVTDGAPSFFAGSAQSVELCSVSACFPHIINYPRPPQGGTEIEGTLVKGRGKGPDTWVLRVPGSLVGDPRAGALLEGLSAYTFARNKTAALPLTNVEAQLGVAPIEVDGVCCRDARL
jgi:hypothetical protein